jgi:hypothetical protein
MKFSILKLIQNFTGADGVTEHRVAALTIEYKAPHKLTLGHIYEGLGEMELDGVAELGDDENLATRCRRLVAAATASFINAHSRYTHTTTRRTSLNETIR